jgi:hypothetical protein
MSLSKQPLVVDYYQPVECECGVIISQWRLTSHKESKTHQNNLFRKKVSEELKKQREEEGRKTDKRNCYYRCDRGIHKGKYLEDVVKFHPDYIDFLIRHHYHSFPPKFSEALRQCGVKLPEVS